jgi:hypothetical protein
MKSYKITFTLGREEKTMIIEAYDKNHAQYKFSYKYWVGLIKSIKAI